MSRFRGCCIPLYTPTSHDDVTRENVGLEWIFVMLSWLNKKHSHCVAMILIMITTLDAFFSYFCDCFASWFYSCRNLVHGHTPTTLFLIPPIHMFPLGKTQSKTNKQRKAIFFYDYFASVVVVWKCVRVDFEVSPVSGCQLSQQGHWDPQRSPLALSLISWSALSLLHGHRMRRCDFALVLVLFIPVVRDKL